MFIIKLQGGHENAKLIEVASDAKIMSQLRLSLGGKTEWDSHTLQQRNKVRSPFYLSNKNCKSRFSFIILIFTYVGKIGEGNNASRTFSFNFNSALIHETGHCFI